MSDEPVTGSASQQLSEAAMEIERLNVIIKRLCNALGSSMLFNDSLIYELARIHDERDKPIPLALLLAKKTLDASMAELFKELLPPFDTTTDEFKTVLHLVPGEPKQ
jgi:hypothetical protein